jgi:hypothetical protein
MCHQFNFITFIIALKNSRPNSFHFYPGLLACLKAYDLNYEPVMAQMIYRRPTGWKARVHFPARARNFSLLNSMQTGSGVHPAYYIMGTGVISPGVKGQGRKADHSPPPSAEVNNSSSIPPLPHKSS